MYKLGVNARLPGVTVDEKLECFVGNKLVELCNNSVFSCPENI